MFFLLWELARIFGHKLVLYKRLRARLKPKGPSTECLIYYQTFMFLSNLFVGHRSMATRSFIKVIKTL